MQLKLEHTTEKSGILAYDEKRASGPRSRSPLQRGNEVMAKNSNRSCPKLTLTGFPRATDESTKVPSSSLTVMCATTTELADGDSASLGASCISTGHSRARECTWLDFPAKDGQPQIKILEQHDKERRTIVPW